MTMPKNLPDIIPYMFPDAVPIDDYTVRQIETKVDGKWEISFELKDWNDAIGTEPTEAELNAKSAEVEAHTKANAYKYKRKYPSWKEQLDMQYHDQIDGTTTWKDAIAKVKADNPKEAE